MNKRRKKTNTTQKTKKTKQKGKRTEKPVLIGGMRLRPGKDLAKKQGPDLPC